MQLSFWMILWIKCLAHTFRCVYLCIQRFYPPFTVYLHSFWFFSCCLCPKRFFSCIHFSRRYHMTWPRLKSFCRQWCIQQLRHLWTLLISSPSLLLSVSVLKKQNSSRSFISSVFKCKHGGHTSIAAKPRHPHFQLIHFSKYCEHLIKTFTLQQAGLCLWWTSVRHKS